MTQACCEVIQHELGLVSGWISMILQAIWKGAKKEDNEYKEAYFLHTNPSNTSKMKNQALSFFFFGK